MLQIAKEITGALASTDFVSALDHSVISSLYLVPWVRGPHGIHVRQDKFCLRMCQVIFLEVLPFSPHLPIGPSHMSCNNCERDVKLNKDNQPRRMTMHLVSDMVVRVAFAGALLQNTTVCIFPSVKLFSLNISPYKLKCVTFYVFQS